MRDLRSPTSPCLRRLFDGVQGGPSKNSKKGVKRGGDDSATADASEGGAPALEDQESRPRKRKVETKDGPAVGSARDGQADPSPPKRSKVKHGKTTGADAAKTKAKKLKKKPSV